MTKLNGVDAADLCARLCDDYGQSFRRDGHIQKSDAAYFLAARIRDRYAREVAGRVVENSLLEPMRHALELLDQERQPDLRAFKARQILHAALEE